MICLHLWGFYITVDNWKLQASNMSKDSKLVSRQPSDLLYYWQFFSVFLTLEREREDTNGAVVGSDHGYSLGRITWEFCWYLVWGHFLTYHLQFPLWTQAIEDTATYLTEMPAWLDHTSVKFFSSFFMGLQSEQRRTKAQSILSLTASSPQLNGIHARSLAKHKKLEGKPGHLFGRSVFLPQSSEGNVLLPCNSLSKNFVFWSELYVTNMWNQLYKTAPRPSVILLIALFSWLVLFILVFEFVSRVP